MTSAPARFNREHGASSLRRLEDVRPLLSGSRKRAGERGRRAGRLSDGCLVLFCYTCVFFVVTSLRLHYKVALSQINLELVRLAFGRVQLWSSFLTKVNESTDGEDVVGREREEIRLTLRTSSREIASAWALDVAKIFKFVHRLQKGTGKLDRVVMKVLVLGATGFLGQPISQALVRAGHEVYGLARTSEKAKQLARDEVIPVIGTVDSDAYMHLIPTLDVVISAINATPDILTNTFNNVCGAAKATRLPGAAKLAYIYSSGTWIHGDDRTTIVSDTTPLTNPVKLLANWLPGLEQQIVASTIVNGIVLRPSLVYGRSGSNFAPLFKAALKEKKVVWPGRPGGRYALVHVDDVADAYVRAAERSSIAAGKIFDISNAQTESVDELLRRLVEVSGVPGPYEYKEPTSLFEEAFSSTAIIRPYLAKALLDWSPRKIGLTDGLEIYYAAWLASSTKSSLLTQ
ncbi:Epimerase domain-containing protein [Mycena indigotica]|uniref:Epimerase domain-containing protein n=1 Tax=Mycena indigotica TaxID=2126181 RepID=A0A8H6S1U2_9AGAR|nr:Epimerase domain-containing protein [Mycena indigotica]KAF7290768.1 Epimerase domain-containing protein [Mycena indigotica]